MFQARMQDKLVNAKDVTRKDSPFFCSGCGAQVLLKKGSCKAHHFAHIADQGCQHGQGEGEIHRRLKDAISAVLLQHSDVKDIQQECRTLKDVSPDVSFHLRGHHIAIEIQVTAISRCIIQRRVQRYTALDIALLWVLPWKAELIDGGRYRPTQWEKFLHSLYRGQVFYWSPDGILQPVAYQSMTTTGTLYHWYENKEEWRLAGQPQKSKTYKRVHLLPQVHITDLVSVIYPAWKTQQIFLPEAKLWTLKPHQRQPQAERGETTTRR